MFDVKKRKIVLSIIGWFLFLMFLPALRSSAKEEMVITSIDFLTTINGIDDYDKSVIITIPAETMDIYGEELRAFMEERLMLPGMVLYCNPAEGYTSFEFLRNHMTGEECKNFYNAIFGKQNVQIKIENVDEYFPSNTDSQYMIENIEPVFYITGNEELVYCNYYVKTANNCIFYSPEDMSYLGPRGDEFPDSEKYSGYVWVQEDPYSGGSLHFPILAQKTHRTFDLRWIGAGAGLVIIVIFFVCIKHPRRHLSKEKKACFCSSCGNMMKKGDSVCKKCGQKINLREISEYEKKGFM